MKKLLTKALSILIASTLLAQEPPKNLIEELFTSRDPEQFPKLLEQAKTTSISPQAILEAKFLYYIDAQDYKAIAQLAPELQNTKFDSDLSEIFTLEDDWLAITKYCESLAALQKNDTVSFKKLITEAFWHSPRQAGAFAPHIEKLKMQQAMASLQLDTKLTLKNLLDNQTTPLIDPNKAATLLYFWSPWSREFDETTEDFKLTNQEALKHNYHVISVLAERSPEVEKDALIFIKEQQIKNVSHWVADTDTHTLAKELRIQNIPTLALITKEGKVTFNGHSSSPDIWTELQKLTPQFKQPSYPKGP